MKELVVFDHSNSQVSILSLRASATDLHSRLLSASTVNGQGRRQGFCQARQVALLTAEQEEANGTVIPRLSALQMYPFAVATWHSPDIAFLTPVTTDH